MAVDAKGRTLIADDRNSMIMRIGKPTAEAMRMVNENIKLTEQELNFTVKDYLNDPIKSKDLVKFRDEVLDKNLYSARNREINSGLTQWHGLANNTNVEIQLHFLSKQSIF